MHFKATSVIIIILIALSIFEVKTMSNVAVNNVRRHLFGYAATTHGGIKITKFFNQAYDSVKDFFFDETANNKTTTSTTTTTIKPELMGLKSNSTILSRTSRQIPLFVRRMGKVGGWGAAWIGVSAASSIIDTYIKNQNEEKILAMVRAKFNCETNNYGCMENVCYTNCGPRISSSDWCITTNPNETLAAKIDTDGTIIEKIEKNTTILKNPPATCETMKDCDPCWSCAGTCVMEN